MKMNEKHLHLSLKGLMIFSALLFFSINFISCEDGAENTKRIITPPDPKLETKILNYYPDSGGVATKIILHGTNLGTDTSYLKVTVNGKNAKIIGCDGDAILAIVPSRAGSGDVKLFVGKGENTKEFSYGNSFKYFFKQNVTTVAGQNGIDGIEDGVVNVATLRRPWEITFDNDGVLYFIDEGRGINSDGGLRKVIDGKVETIMRNSSGLLQSPTSLAFNLSQDTLFMIQTIWTPNDNSMTTDGTVAYLTRNEGFSVIKAYVKYSASVSFKSTGIAVHPQTGDIFFNSQSDGYIYKVNKSTREGEKLFQVNGTETELKLVFDPSGDYLYIIVKNKHCIYKAKYNYATRKVENPTVFAGQWNASGYVDGFGTAAKFNIPGQGTFDEFGNLYIPDKGNHCIRQITPAGMVTTFAGVGGQSGYKDGNPLEALFNQPECVKYNPVDRGWYVADRQNSLIRKILVE